MSVPFAETFESGLSLFNSLISQSFLLVSAQLHPSTTECMRRHQNKHVSKLCSSLNNMEVKLSKCTKGATARVNFEAKNVLPKKSFQKN